MKLRPITVILPCVACTALIVGIVWWQAPKKPQSPVTSNPTSSSPLPAINDLQLPGEEDVYAADFDRFAVAGNLTPSEYAAPSHARMLRLLAEIATRTPVDNPWLGTGSLESLKTQLQSANATDYAARFHLHRRLGEQELRLGNTANAILQYHQSYTAGTKLDSSIVTRDLDPGFWLGVAFMRWGEDQNCVQHHTAQSCLFPISEGGVHQQADGAENAIRHFEGVLSRHPGHLEARWLLNIAYMTLGRYPGDVPKQYLIDPKTFRSDEDIAPFVNISSQLGLDTFNLSGGMIVDDFDGDGQLDLITSSLDTANQLRYFRGEAGGKFTEVSERANLSGILGGLNLVSCDYDNDGDVDVLVLRGAWMEAQGNHPNSLLSNNGDGSFTDVTFDCGLGESHHPTQTAAWADYDNDGDLDLYIGNEYSKDNPSPSQLFRNNGDNTFTDVADEAGVQNLRFTKGVSWGDFDNDGFTDLYVSNLMFTDTHIDGENRLYRNQGNGTFVDVAGDLDLIFPLASFPVWFWDYDNDGALDIYVASFCSLQSVVASYLGMPNKGWETDSEPAALYRGNGHGEFEDVAPRVNLNQVTMTMGANFGDLDNDGYLDFYLGTGSPNFLNLVPNIMYRNRGGQSFADVSTSGGFAHLQKGHGVAFADLDNDGDQDVIEQMGGAYPGDKFGDVVFENPGFSNNWLKVDLVGTRSNRAAFGVVVRAVIVEAGKERSIYRHTGTGASFGANPKLQHIGIGKAEAVKTLEVRWPASGQSQTFNNVAANQIVQIVEGHEHFTPKTQRSAW